MNDIDIAWMAGFFDGDGSVGAYRYNSNGYIRKKNVELRVAVVSIYKPIIEHIQSMFGGTTYEDKSSAHDSRYYRVWRWYMHSNKASRFLKTILPYLVVKREQAELSIQLQRHVNLRNYAKQEELRKQITYISHNREIPVKRCEPLIHNLSDTDLSLLAGYIDSEGCIGIFNGVSLRTSLRIVNRSGLFTDNLISLYGGNIHVCNDKRDGKVDATWGVYGNNANRILNAVYPFLRQKRDQAYVALRLKTDYRHRKDEAIKLMKDLKRGSEVPFNVCNDNPYKHNPQMTFSDYS